MAWEPPEGICLDDAYYDIITKITNNSWNKFARSGLRLDQHDMDEIDADYRRDRKEQKYRMCKKWQESVGSNATVENLYATLNHYLFPEKYPRPMSAGKGKRGDAVAKFEGGRPCKLGTSGATSSSDDAVSFQGKGESVTVTPASEPPKPEGEADLAQFCSDISGMKITPSTRDFINSNKSLSSIYKMTGKNGNVLIINNSFRNSRRCYRQGSEVDVKNMEELWKHLGCKVTVCEDMFADDIISKLKNFSDDSEGYDYCAAVIMSHGDCDAIGQDYIYGNDMEKVCTKRILEMFNNKESPHLQNIPRLFFFQSCRGKKEDKGTPVHTPTSTQRAFVDTQVIVPGKEVKDHDANDAGPTETLPTSSDMLIAYATQMGDKAFRHTTEGSWFINAIVNVFMQHAKDEHVLDLMVRVNNAVAAKSASEDGGKAMSHIEFNLRKKLYLFPGLFPK